MHCLETVYQLKNYFFIFYKVEYCIRVNNGLMFFKYSLYRMSKKQNLKNKKKRFAYCLLFNNILLFDCIDTTIHTYIIRLCVFRILTDDASGRN